MCCTRVRKSHVILNATLYKQLQLFEGYISNNDFLFPWRFVRPLQNIFSLYTTLLTWGKLRLFPQTSVFMFSHFEDLHQISLFLCELLNTSLNILSYSPLLTMPRIWLFKKQQQQKTSLMWRFLKIVFDVLRSKCIHPVCSKWKNFSDQMSCLLTVWLLEKTEETEPVCD